MSSKRKKRNWVLIPIISILILLGAGLVFKESIRKQFTSMLQEQLDAALPPEYELNFDKLELDFQTQILNLKGLRLSPDTSITKNRFYEVYIPNLEVHIRSYWDAIFERSLIIDRIWINNPALKVNIGKRENVQTNFSSESFGFLDVIQASLAHLEVGDFEVNKAEVSYQDHREASRNNLILDNVNLLITDFAIDSNRQVMDFMSAAEVLLKVSGDTFLLSDQNHELSFDNLELSLRDSILNFSGIRLQPLLINPKKQVARIDFQAPLVSFSGINFRKSYQERNLQLDRLYIHKPIFDFKENPSLLNPKKNKNAIQLALEKLATGIRIKEIVLDQAGIDLNFIKKKQREVQFGVDSIVIYEFELNENTRFFDGNLPFADIEFVLRDIRQDLPGNFLGIGIKKARFSTIAEEITLQDIAIGKEGDRSQFFQSIPFIALSGLDIFSALKTNRVVVEELFLDRPSTSLFITNDRPKQEKQNNDLLSGIAIFFQKFFFKEIEAKRLHIHDGSLKYNEQLSIDSIHYSAKDITLNNQVENWSEIFSDFELELEKIKLDSDSLDLNIKSYFTNGDRHRIDSTYLQWSDVGDTITAYLPSLSISNVRLDTLFKGFLQADSLLCPNAKADVRLINRSVQDEKSRLNLPLNIAHLVSSNLAYYIQSGQGNQLSGNFDFLSGTVKDSLTIDYFRTSNLALSALDLPYDLNINEFEKQKNKDDFELSGIELIPKKEKIQQDSSIYLDRLRIWGLEWEKGLRTKEWVSRKIIINEMKMDLNLAAFMAKDGGKGATAHFPSIEIDTTLIFNGDLSAYDPIEESKISLPEVSLAVYQLSTKGLSNWDNIYTGLILEGIKGLKFENPDWHFSQNNIIFNADYELLILEEVLLQSKSESPFQSIYFNSLAINGFDPLTYFQTGQIDLKVVKVDNTLLTMNHFKPESGNSIDINLPELHLEELELSDVDLEFSQKSDLKLDGISISARDLKLDSTSAIQKIDEYFGALSISIDTMHYTLGDNSVYDVGLKMRYEKGEAGLRINDFNLIKNLPDSIFSRQLQYRTDYWGIYAKEIQVPDLPMSNLFSKPLIVPKIAIDGLSARDFNDERIPLKPTYKPLPHQQLKEVSFPFQIDSLLISGELRYDAMAPLSGKKSWITLNDLDILVANLSSLPSNFAKGLQVHARGALYASAPFEVKLDFDMLDTLAAFKMEGIIDNLDLSLLNPMLRPQAAVQINKGNSRKILFNMAANDEIAVGDMLFRYKRLRVQLLDKEDVTNSSFGNSFLSFWANRLVSSNNPSWLSRRKGTIYFERDQQKAISHFWVHSLLSGAVSSAGVKNNKRKLKKSGIPNLEEMDYQRLYKQQLSKLKEDGKEK